MSKEFVREFHAWAMLLLARCSERVKMTGIPDTAETVKPPGIPSTAVSGSFILRLPRKAPIDRLLPEYHPREWVDRSSSAYKGSPTTASGIPPTAVGGIRRIGSSGRRL